MISVDLPVHRFCLKTQAEGGGLPSPLAKNEDWREGGHVISSSSGRRHFLNDVKHESPDLNNPECFLSHPLLTCFRLFAGAEIAVDQKRESSDTVLFGPFKYRISTTIA